MPLGDSITEGTLSGGWRRKFFMDNSRFIPTGSLTSDPPPSPYPADRLHHEGHAGFGTAQIIANLPTYWAANPATFVLLFIGTNDALGAFPASYTEANVATIVDYIHAQSPATFIYVAGITNADSSLTAMNAIIDAQRPLVAAVAAARTWCKYVPMPHLLDAEMDGFAHPNTTAAYDKLADAWTGGLR